VSATGPADDAPTLLLCSETDDLSGLCADFEAAAARDCPVLRVACWTPGTPPAVLDRVVAIAGWFVPLGLPARLPRLRLLASIGAGVEHLLRDPDLPPSKRTQVQSRYLHSVTDGSRVFFVTGSFDATDAMVLFASATVTGGPRDGEFSRIGRGSIVVGATYTW